MKKNDMMNLNTIGLSEAAMTALEELFPSMNVRETFINVIAEWNKNAAKSEANAKAYAATKAPMFAVMSTTPQTAQEIFDACEDELPEGFTVGKIRWALNNLWKDEIIATDNGKNPKTYALREETDEDEEE